MTDSNGMLITWRDVRDRLATAGVDLRWEVDLFGLRVFSDDTEGAVDTLSRVFGAAYSPDGPEIDLLSGTEGRRSLAVEVLPADEAPPFPPRVARPLWASGRIDEPPKAHEGAATVAAFFSFKGGVGRTLSCYATAVQLLDRADPPRVLYVDADVEAPGLTWLLPPVERMAWVDALALVHDSDDWRREALPLIAEQVALSRVELELDAGRRAFFALPAVRRLEQVERPPVTPEQAVRRRGRAWVVGDLLLALAEALQIDVILLDLRAGITEFSSPLMLDPRVRNVLVTSCAEQSVRGTERAFELVAARASWSPRMDVLVTKVPRDGDTRFEEVNRRIDLAWAGSADEDDGDDPSPDVYRVDFSDTLLAFEDLQAVASRLGQTPLGGVAAELAESLRPSVREPVEANSELDDSPLARIAELAAQLEYAEGNAELRLLASPPLKNLVRVPPGKLPATVVLGAKGAGKTFAWGQMVIAQRWSRFCEAVREESHEDADVFPLLLPTNLRGPMRQRALNAEEAFRPSDAARLTSTELAAWLRRAGSDVGDEVAAWSRVIADRLGLPVEAGRSPRSLEAALREQGRRVVLVVDGIEDALQVSPEAPMPATQRSLLRALLVDFVVHLSDLGPHHLGLVVFVRRDLAHAAIPQNFGQFEARHRDVALSWSRTDALRLVLWLLKEAGWSLLDADALAASYKTLARSLHPFWGEKMGGRKEAFTDRWVIAALSDLNGRFQARDLVRLVQHATSAAQRLPLPPASLRDAVRYCSEKKIEELEIEVEGLRPVFDKLRALSADRRTIPIGRAVLPLDDEEISFLTEQGILHLDEAEDMYYMPEIVRHGLHFGLGRRGRARVLSLLRAAMRGHR